MRITATMVRSTFNSLVQVAGAAGLDTEGWVLESGSQTYGRSWRIYKRSEGGGLRTIGSDSYLGYTTREAYHALRGMENGLAMIAYQVPAK